MRYSPQGPEAQIVREAHAFLEDPINMEAYICFDVENKDRLLRKRFNNLQLGVFLTGPPVRPIGPSTPLGPGGP